MKKFRLSFKKKEPTRMNKKKSYKGNRKLLTESTEKTEVQQRTDQI